MPSRSWTLAGNAGTDPPNTFLGTTDDRPLVVKTNGAPALYLDPEGNIGVGTTSPGQKLDIEGFAITANGSSAFELTCDADGAHFWTNNSYRRSEPLTNWTRTLSLRDGNVGIGISAPEATLHVSSGADYNTPQCAISQTTPNDFARLRFLTLGIDPDSGARPFPLWDIAAGQNALNFFRQDVGNVVTLIGGQDPGAGALSARVGIGEDNPQRALDVNGTARVNVLEVTGGTDLAERFDVAGTTTPEPGTVMVIDEKSPGKLRISDTAYDSKVAGVVTGAGAMQPGLTLSHDRWSERCALVALAGQIYCKAEANSGPIQAGDLLTTSDIPGHAMKAERRVVDGVILGKAMSPLAQATGLVRVFVSLR
jgi:hypothetical protein